MKKLFLVSIFCICSSMLVLSQKKPIGYIAPGVAFFTPWSYHKDAVFFPAFTLSPGIKCIQGKDVALVLNFPISAGLTFKSDAFAGIDLPAMLNLHFGSATGNNPAARVGIVVGAGAAYINVVNYYDNQYNDKVHTEFWGYRFNLGVSFKESSSVVPAIICSYGKSINKRVGNVIGIGLQLIVKGL